jgi:hypothetical protein
MRPWNLFIETIKKAVQAGNTQGCLSNLTVSGAINREGKKEFHLKGVDIKGTLSLSSIRTKSILR